MSDNAPNPGMQIVQYVQYALFRVAPEWRRLPAEERAAHKEEVADLLEAWSERLELIPYSLVGTRRDADLMLWLLTDRFDDFRELQASLNGTGLGAYMERTYSYLGGTKPSKYFDRDPKRPPRRVVPRRGPYLVVYPMVKIRPWYALPMEERVQAMREHAEVGQRWPTVTNHTTYSFGIDDQEFMPAFECETPADFLELMMALRETEASKYTLTDTPIFVGSLLPLRQLLDELDGVASAVESGA